MTFFVNIKSTRKNIRENVVNIPLNFNETKNAKWKNNDWRAGKCGTSEKLLHDFRILCVQNHVKLHVNNWDF